MKGVIPPSVVSRNEGSLYSVRDVVEAIYMVADQSYKCAISLAQPVAYQGEEPMWGVFLVDCPPDHTRRHKTQVDQG